MWLKACPRCGGDMYRDLDIRGEYRQCLQCGYTLYEAQRRRRPVTGSAKTPPDLPSTPSMEESAAEPRETDINSGSLPRAA